MQQQQMQHLQRVNAHVRLHKFRLPTLDVHCVLLTALVDANIMNQIDYDRFFDPSATDICKLIFWSLPCVHAVDPADFGIVRLPSASSVLLFVVITMCC